jgi:NADPH2:quinone reductase
MRAWRVHELGDPGDVMRLDQVDDPVPGEGQLLVRVAAASLNFPDVLMCQGKYQTRPPLPFTPGVELSGTVVAVGAGVDRYAVGDEVLGPPAAPTGGLATLALVDAAMALPAIPTFTPAQNAGYMLTYQTGYVGLHRRAGLRAGETLLVHGGAGGVGTAAIQLGKAAGARVIATAGGPDKVQVCLRMGADHAIDYRAEDFVPIVKELTGGAGADVVYDPVGGEVFEKSCKVTAWEGRLLVVGFTSGAFGKLATNYVLLKNFSVVGLHWGVYRQKDPAVVAEAHEAMTTLAAAGLIAPYVAEELPFDAAPSALERLASRRTVGKVVVLPGR